MDLILNDLSAKFPQVTIELGRDVMERFLLTYQKIKKIIHNDHVFLNQDYSYIELAENYNIAQWRNDKCIDEDIKRLFRIMLNRGDLYNPLSYNSQFSCQGLDSVGCLLAYEMNGCTISFLSDPIWEESIISGEYQFLNVQGDIVAEKAEVPNVSNDQNIEKFRRDFGIQCDQELQNNFKSGNDILVKSSEIFPNLVFCKNAIKQLKYEIDSCNIKQITRKLMELQNYFSIIDNIFDATQLNHATPESPETLKAYQDDHTFEMPNGDKKVFSWHIRFTGKFEGRIFFEPDARDKKCYIGHIGGKLNSVKYH